MGKGMRGAAVIKSASQQGTPASRLIDARIEVARGPGVVSERGVSPGQVAFATAAVAVGVLGLVVRDFVAYWQPVPRTMPARETLAYACAFLCLLAGAALPWWRTAARAAGVLLASYLALMVLLRLPSIAQAPTAAVAYESWGECAVMVAGAWVLLAFLAEEAANPRYAWATGASGLRIARWCYGLALLAFGVSHFAYVRDTAALVPTWLPAHATWVYVTGCAYLAAGGAVLSGVAARTAATLAALQMGLFTLLVWIPAVAGAYADVSQWSELLDSAALAAGAWVVAAALGVDA
jgi:uncharacterized membrane protein